jgi:4-aminobutyrate aminotransferase-like enzyme
VLAVQHRRVVPAAGSVDLQEGAQFDCCPADSVETLEPAAEETSAICDRMLELGVIIQPTGDHMNILKTKPPLCIDVEAADFYVDTLDRVLTENF